VTVTATGSQALSGWSADWSFAAGQTVQNAWGATVGQSGGSVHAVNAGYNAAVAPGNSVTFGFQGTGAAPSAPSLSCTPA
jgi:cellulase/cellobiase CelA1